MEKTVETVFQIKISRETTVLALKILFVFLLIQGQAIEILV